MKNKGRKHLSKSMNCKGWKTWITRPIESMGKGVSKRLTGYKSNKITQRWWNKRVRQYLKTTHGQEIFQL